MIKKLTSKKVNIFGKSVPVFVIALLGLAFVSAALVPYISNAVTGTVNVESPLNLTISLDNSTWSNSINFGTIYGSDSIGMYTKLTNNADKKITAENVTTIISNDIGNATCEDFSAITYGANGVSNIGSVNCVDNITTGSETAVLTTSPVVLASGQSQYVTFNLTTKINIAPANYTFKAYIPAEGATSA